MKITERKNENGSKVFKFDNGAWVSICLGIDYGSWEYQSDEDDEETYLEGGLWFDGKEVTDYDGCYELPEEVKMALHDMDYKLEEE